MLPVTGGVFHVRTIYRAGSSCQVFTTPRWHHRVARSMRRRGFSPYAIAILLKRPRQAVDRALAFAGHRPTQNLFQYALE